MIAVMCRLEFANRWGLVVDEANVRGPWLIVREWSRFSILPSSVSLASLALQPALLRWGSPQGRAGFLPWRRVSVPFTPRVT